VEGEFSALQLLEGGMLIGLCFRSGTGMGRGIRRGGLRCGC